MTHLRVCAFWSKLLRCVCKGQAAVVVVVKVATTHAVIICYSPRFSVESLFTLASRYGSSLSNYFMSMGCATAV